MAGAVVTPAGGQPVNLKSALKKGSTRRKRQVVIDEARNTYCEATSYFYEDVPLPRRRDLALKKGAQQKTGEDPASAATMTAVSLPSEPRGKGALHGRDGVVKKNPMDKAPPADAEGTTGSEKGYKRVPSSDTLVTALLTDSLLALTSSSGPRGDNHQFWRPNLPDLVTESVEGDSGKGDSSPEETRGSPVGDDSAEAPANTFRVIKADDPSTDSGDAGTDLDQQGPDAPVATSTSANETPSVTVSEPVSPKFSEIVAERPISVLITDTETDSDAIDSPRKPSNTNSQTTLNDNFVKSSSLPALNTSVNSNASEPSEPGSPSSDTDLSALSNADSPDRFWKLSPGTRRIDDFPASPATSSGSSASSSPPAWDRSPSGSPPRRSPPSLASLDISRESTASRDSGASPDSPPSPPDSPPPALADDGYSLDDIEDALRDEPPSPAPEPPSTAPPSTAPPARQEPAGHEELTQQQQPRQQQRGPEEGVCVEEELAGFVEGQTERTERLRRRYAAAEDGGFIRRPSVRGVVIQQGPAGPQQQQAYQQPIYQQQQQQQQQIYQQQQQQQLYQQRQEQMYWQQQNPQQQQRQPPPPSSAQHSQLHRQHSLQPRPGPPAQMAPPSASHTRQQSAPMLVRPGAEAQYQRPPMERPQQPREEMYVTVRPAEMHPERLGHGQQQRQVAPPQQQQGRGYQPPPPPPGPGQIGQIPQYSAPMQQLPAPVQQQRSALIYQQQQQQQQYQHAYQPSGPGPLQQPLQNRPQPGFNNPASQLQPPPQQQQQHYQQQPQYQSQQQFQNQQQQQQAAVARPVPMGQTRQQQLEQIRRLQSNHMVRVPAVTVGFPDETSRRQVSHWNAPAWLPSAGGVRGGARERESFRAGRQRSASQQRLEAVGRPASLALPRASEWPQDRAPPPGGIAPPQPPPRFCEPSVVPPGAGAMGPGAGAGAVTLPRRFAASPEVTGSLPRHQRLSSASGWPGDGPPPPPQHQPYPPPPTQQTPAPGASRWYERSAPMQTASGTARGAPPPQTRTRPPPQAEPLYVQRPPARGVSLEDLSADECDV